MINDSVGTIFIQNSFEIIWNRGWIFLISVWTAKVLQHVQITMIHRFLEDKLGSDYFLFCNEVKVIFSFMADFADEAVDVEFTTNWVYFTLLKWMKKGPTKDSIKDIMAGVSVLALILALRNMKCQEYIIILGDSSALEGIQCRNPMIHCLSKEKQG